MVYKSKDYWIAINIIIYSIIGILIKGITISAQINKPPNTFFNTNLKFFPFIKMKTYAYSFPIFLYTPGMVICSDYRIKLM
jgi:hypothetical protein